MNSNYCFTDLVMDLCPKKFHETCDDQSHTVTVAKVKDSNEILGGYNSMS